MSAENNQTTRWLITRGKTSDSSRGKSIGCYSSEPPLGPLLLKGIGAILFLLSPSPLISAVLGNLILTWINRVQELGYNSKVLPLPMVCMFMHQRSDYLNTECPDSMTGGKGDILRAWQISWHYRNHTLCFPGPERDRGSSAFPLG